MLVKPASQGVQAALPLTSVCSPALQVLHCSCPARSWYWEAGQGWQELPEVGAKVPGLQALQDGAPAALLLPGLQGVQTEAPVAEKEPVLQFRQAEAPAAGWKLPALH